MLGQSLENLREPLMQIGGYAFLYAAEYAVKCLMYWQHKKDLDLSYDIRNITKIEYCNNMTTARRKLMLPTPLDILYAISESKVQQKK